MDESQTGGRDKGSSKQAKPADAGAFADAQKLLRAERPAPVAAGGYGPDAARAAAVRRAAALRSAPRRPVTAARRRPPATRARRVMTDLAALAAMLAAAFAVVATVKLTTSGGPSYVTRAHAALTPVAVDTADLGAAIAALSTHSGTSRATSAAEASIASVHASQRALARLAPGTGDARYAAHARAALAAELAWLRAAVAVLRNPHDARALARLGPLAARARADLALLPGVVASFPSSAKLTAYTRHRLARASSKPGLQHFDALVQGLLADSAPGYQELRALSAPGRSRITVGQAEAIITSIVANDSSLVTSARALPAPTRLAVSVRAALTAAYQAAAANDQGIAACLAQAGTAPYARASQKCVGEWAATTAAGQQFLALYNQLRASIGEAPATAQF
jgi:hypothetical protein